MKYSFRAAILALLIAAPSCGFMRSTTTSSVTPSPAITNTFQTLKTCGGGWLVGADVSANGVRFVRGDVFFGYMWGNDNKWHNLVTTTTMPASLQGFSGTGFNQVYNWYTTGVNEIAGAPSDATVAYMNVFGHLLVSQNISKATPDNISWTDAVLGANITGSISGTTLTVTAASAVNIAVGDFVYGASNGTAITALGTGTGGTGTYTVNNSQTLNSGSYYITPLNEGSNGRWRQAGRRLAVDPNNKAHVLVATEVNGVWETTNALAANPIWTRIPDAVLPAAQTFDSAGNGNNPSYNIVFDPASGVNGSGLTNALYIFTPSVSNSGVYRTVNGSVSSLTLTASGPTTAMMMMKSSQTGDVIWAVDAPSASGGAQQSGGLWKFTATGGGVGSGAWSHVFTSGYHSVAVNPLNANHAALLADGGYFINLWNGSTWSGNLAPGVLPGDSPYQAVLGVALSPGDINFDGVTNDLMVMDGGQGVWTVPYNLGGLTYTNTSSGTEGFIAEQIVVPQANMPLIGGQDLGVFAYNPIVNGCSVTPFALNRSGMDFGLHRDQVASLPGVPNWAVAKDALDFGTAIDVSGISNDGFQNNHVPYSSKNFHVSATAATNNGSGAVRITTSAANVSGLSTWSLGSGTIICSVAYTTQLSNILNGTCYPVTVVDSTHFDLQGSFYSSTVNNGLEVDTLFWVPTPPLSSWNGQGTIANVSNNFGSITVSIEGLAFSISNGWMVCISGVGGVTAANGCWTVASTQVGGNFTGSISGTTLTVTAMSNGTLNVGDSIGGSGVTANTLITAQGSGVGGTGTYTVSNSQTVGSEAMSLGSNFEQVTLGPASTFSGTYTTGGVLTTYQEPGGTVAAASKTNIVSAGANNGIPRCTTDGGLTWTNFTASAGWPHTWATVATSGGASAGGTSITVVSATDLIQSNGAFLYIPLADGRTHYTGYSVVGNVVTMNRPVPKGTSIADGTNINFGSGYQFAAFLFGRAVTADTVTANTFYSVIGDAGFYKWTNCGTATQIDNHTITSGGTDPQKHGGFNVSLKAAPGEAGHLFYTPGPEGTATHPDDTGLWRACNGNTVTQNSLNWLRVPGTYENTSFGFGVAKPGGTGYPTIMFVGWYDRAETGASPEYGFWLSTDDINHGNVGTSNTCNSHSATFTGSTSGTVLTVSAITTGSIVVNQGLGGSGISDKTLITAQLTGSAGSTGTYRISNSQSLGSRALFSGGTWSKVAVWPGGWAVDAKDIAGDPTVYGEWYIATGAGSFTGVFQ